MNDSIALDELDAAQFLVYLESSPEKRLMMLSSDWMRAKTQRHRTFIEGRMIELTIGMKEHPDGFNHGCLCQECRECA